MGNEGEDHWQSHPLTFMPSPMHTIEIFTNSAHFLNLEKVEKLLFRFSRGKEEIKQKPKEFLLAF